MTNRPQIAPISEENASYLISYPGTYTFGSLSPGRSILLELSDFLRSNRVGEVGLGALSSPSINTFRIYELSK